MIADRRINALMPCGKYVTYLLALLLLGGCTLFAPQPQKDVSWRIEGKIGVKIDKKGSSARFWWQQRANTIEIEVWGPLGQGRTRFTGMAEDLMVTQGDKILAQGPAAQVMQHYLGWYLPVHVMSDWVFGQPSADFGVSGTKINNQGQITAFRQLGWQVECSDFRPFDTVQYPRKLRIAKENTQITLVQSHVQPKLATNGANTD